MEQKRYASWIYLRPQKWTKYGEILANLTLGPMIPVQNVPEGTFLQKPGEALGIR